jgi:Ca-activated chloride channel family protein
VADARDASRGDRMTLPSIGTLADFHFLRPLALLLLLALPLFWLAWRNGRSDAGAWRSAVDAHLLPHLMERIDGGPGRGGLVLAALLWTLACAALAGPAWEREPMPLYRNQAARVLALELSATMLAQDEKPSRLARARFKLDDILTRSRDYQTALIGYAGDAFVAAPLTDDIGTVRNLIDALDPGTMPVGGNATERAIDAGVNLIQQAGLHRGEIIVLADSVGSLAVAAASKAKAAGITVSVLGIGSAAGAPVPLAQGDFMKDPNGGISVARLDEKGLRALADAGGGRYAALAPDARDLDSLLGNRVEGVDRGGGDNPAASAQNVDSARWRDRGPWLLLLLAPLASFGFRRGWLMALALVLSAPVRHADAASFADLWQRSDQQAAQALAEGNAKQAADVARSPDWRGGASYKAGDFGTAADAYTHVGGADGAYNKGNALAKLGRYDDAIAAYDAALKIAPDMEDAQTNRKAVEGFLKQSKQDKSKQSGSKDQKKDGQDSQKHDGENKPQDEQDGPKDQQKGQQPGQDDKQKDSSEGKGEKDDKDSKDKDAQGSDDKNLSSNPGSDAKDKAGGAPTGPDEQQQKALSKEIDKALADKPEPADKDAKAQAGTVQEDETTRQKKQALEHWLQRVPDDPGGLLRRKFQLEYQRRQQRGGEGG